MPKIQYKSPTGTLHIGKGVFFYANQTVEVSDAEAKKLLKQYPNDLEECIVPETEPPNDNPKSDKNANAK